jgi:hypothetical protein
MSLGLHRSRNGLQPQHEALRTLGKVLFALLSLAGQSALMYPTTTTPLAHGYQIVPKIVLQSLSSSRSQAFKTCRGAIVSYGSKQGSHHRQENGS